MTTIVTVSYPGDAQDDYVTVHEHSTGGRRTGITFNPSDHAGTRKLKALAAAFVDACHLEQQNLHGDDNEGQRCFTRAMNHAELAQMLAVKGLFTRRNAGKE